MALIGSAKSKSTLQKPIHSEFLDITSNLPTLQFESAILEEYRDYSCLRARSHAITASICSQIVYFVRVLNEIRDRNLSLKYFGRNKTAKILMDDVPNDPINVGIIGGGRMGSHIARCLLSYGEVKPADLRISTRRPDTLEEFQIRGVKCMYDNDEVAKSSNLLILAILPSQFPIVADDIKKNLSKRTTVYSIMPSVPIARLRQLMNYQFIVKPDISQHENADDELWDFTKDIPSILLDELMVEKTCPLGLKKERNVIKTSSKLAEVILYSAVNMCTQLHIPRCDTLVILHDVLFGLDEDEANILIERNFTRMDGEPEESFPKFDTSIIAENNTPLTRKLQDKRLQELFVNKYVSYFIEHTHKVKMGVLRC